MLGCHPLPCLAVTLFAAGYGWAIGGDPAQLLSIAAAVLAGQLCVGWSNDAIDGAKDRAAARLDKPIPAGMVGQRTVATASVIAGLVCLPLSLRLGAAAAGLHFVAVFSALTYNAGLKSTVLSPLPYMLSFGLLPVVVTLSVQSDRRTPVLHLLAAVLLGGAAHFGNTVGDAQADAITGVRGLPQRLGPRLAQAVMALLVGAAAVVMLTGVLLSPAAPGVRGVALVLLIAGVLVAAAGTLLQAGVRGGHTAWRLTLLAVGLVVAGFLVAARR